MLIEHTIDNYNAFKDKLFHLIKSGWITFDGELECLKYKHKPFAKPYCYNYDMDNYDKFHYKFKTMIILDIL